MDIYDALQFDAESHKRLTNDGYLIANVLVARTGVQVYSGDQAGKPEFASVRVYRPPAEVFAKDSLNSYAHKPVTIEHPRDGVNSKNWDGIAKGHLDAVLSKDGEFVRVPMMLCDAKAIADVETGKRELSMGYTCDLEWSPGVVPDGERDAGLQYDAIQKNIRANHLAVVDRARGGPDLRIKDENAMPENLKRVLVDGLPIDTNDAGAATIDKLIGDRTRLQTALDTLAASKAEVDKAIGTKDGEIVALKQQVKDAQLTDAQIDARAEAKAITIAAAKKIMGDKFEVKGSEAEIKAAVVNAKLGDAAKPLSADGIAGAFATLAAGVTVAGATQQDALRAGIAGSVATTDAGAAAWQKSVNDDQNAWKNGNKPLQQ